jgi:hypothetical protein
MMKKAMIQYTEYDNSIIAPTAVYDHILLHLLVRAENGGVLN